jgi:DNA-binding transcriptional MerR regulator
VADMFNVNTSLLRYWEGEFGMQLRKNRKGDRFFTPLDVKNLQLIHDLVRRRKFTIEGAKDYLKKNTRADDKYVMIQSLQRLKIFLLELKAHL